MKKISLNDYNEYLEKTDLKFYFSIIFEDMGYMSIADNYFVFDDRKGKVVVKRDAFASNEFITFVYNPFIESLRGVKLVEGEILDEMFAYSYANTIRASKDNIYVMLHGGSKEYFVGEYSDPVVNSINKKAYDFFASIDNSVDRKIFLDIKAQVIQFIKDYRIDKDE